ncbi:MAG: CoA transferase [Dehalococcoidia bacterium]|jgi:formyl-CoA transferase|nr:CoA transferase [Dehalococcoidia bacterium]
MRPLDGIKVIDFTDWETGPLATQFLGDFGADIIKVEQPDPGGWHRSFGVMLNGINTFHLALNHSKRSISLDLKHPDGNAAIKNLVAEADCVLHNFRPGVMERLGLDYESVRNLNPGIVYGECSGWGMSGTWANRPGQDLLALALTGALKMVGDDAPQPSANYKADYIAGMHLLSATLAALIAKIRFGVGQRIHVSLLASQVHNQLQEAEAYLNCDFLDRDPQRYRLFETADGWIAVGVNFPEICELVERPALASDPRFDTAHKALDRRDEWCEIVAPLFREHPTAHWDDKFRDMNSMFAPVLSYDEAFDHPQVRELGLMTEIEHPHGGTFKGLGMPMYFSETPMSMTSRPPALGEHTEEILTEAGLSTDEIATMIRDRIAFQYNPDPPDTGRKGDA